MASSYTYDTLVTALQDTTEDQGQKYLDAIPRIIALAEDRVLRDLNLERFNKSDTLNIVAGSPFVVRPTDLIALRSMFFVGASGLEVVTPKTVDYALTYWPDVAATTGTPKYYAEYDETQWYLAGTPTSNGEVQVRYTFRPTGLSSGNTETWLATNVGDLLFYAALVASEQYLKADERIPVWGADYTERLGKARFELRRETNHDYQPMTAVPKKE